MVNYSQAKVYKIVDNTNGNVYVGSTCEPTLARRLAKHVGNYKSYLNGNGSCLTSYQIIKNNDYDIVLIENCESISSKDELKARERFYIENLTCVNKNIPLRTNKEYREAHKEYYKQYYQAHKKYDKQYHKEYYETHKEEYKKYNEAHKKYNEEHKAEIKEKRQAKKNKTITDLSKI